MTLQLRRGAWFGDEPYHLEFPQRWQVQVAGRGTIPCLEESGIQRAFTDPVGCKSIAELARGKRKAAIIIDDITRPTPTADLLPWIVGEVVRGGISPSSIVIVVAGGTHPVPTEGEIALKVGDLNHPGLRVVPHDCRGTLVYLGRSRAGIPIHVNPDVVECDLKVGVGCVYPHPAAGFSGGSKILLPAACGMETIRYMHDYIPGARERGDDAPTPLRSAMEEVADLLGLDCVVNAVLNQERRIAALYVGEKELAYRQGVGFVKKAYGVPRIPGANVVIADMYPFDTTLQFAHDRGLWPVLETDRNATGVVLADCPMGVGSHDLYPVETPLRTRLLR
ncbi:MAG: DUF2088 domain-containing protein, partial [Bacteroidetes bacterium]|nr:DUF2088 domain-containing protein [Bacteroidota bacterium]